MNETIIRLPVKLIWDGRLVWTLIVYDRRRQPIEAGELRLIPFGAARWEVRGGPDTFVSHPTLAGAIAIYTRSVADRCGLIVDLDWKGAFHGRTC